MKSWPVYFYAYWIVYHRDICNPTIYLAKGKQSRLEQDVSVCVRVCVGLIQGNWGMALVSVKAAGAASPACCGVDHHRDEAALEFAFAVTHTTSSSVFIHLNGSQCGSVCLWGGVNKMGVNRGRIWYLIHLTHGFSTVLQKKKQRNTVTMCCLCGALKELACCSHSSHPGWWYFKPALRKPR